jgi:hypothetical protein
MDHMTEKMRPLDAKPAPRVVGVQHEQTLAGRDQQQKPLFKGTGHCGLPMLRMRWRSIPKPDDRRDPTGVGSRSYTKASVSTGLCRFSVDFSGYKLD